MKVNLMIKDVGGLKGEHSYKFETGKPWIIKGSNSGGKTSLVRALTAVISIPSDGDLGRSRGEALKLGIKRDERNPQEGFVNIHARTGEVNLTTDRDSFKYKVKQNGDYIELPVEGDNRFLLTGILSNDTRILRQLKDVDDRYQPDDFRWAVDDLSYAGSYVEIIDLLKNKKDELSNLQVIATKKLKQKGELEREKVGLIKDRENTNKKLEGLRSKHKEIEGLDKRDKLTKEIASLKESIGKLKGSYSQEEMQLPSIERRFVKIDKEIVKKKKELDEFNVEGKRKNKENREKEIETEINSLIEDRNRSDGLLNLLVTAQSSLRKEKHVIDCPLCQSGSLKYNVILKRVEKMRTEKDTLNGEITKLNLEKKRLNKELEDEIERKKDLKNDIGNLEEEKKSAKKKFIAIQSSIGGVRDTVRKKEIEIEKAEEKIKQINKKIDPKFEEIRKKYDIYDKKYKEISDRIAVINQKLEETTIEISEEIVKPDTATRILKSWQEVIEDLIDYSKKKAEEQRQMAAGEFNRNIQEMMNTLGFKEFRKIMLNKDYRLYVERFDPNRKVYVSQQVKTLSTSEKLSIALILQIALKETYIPDTPFFIIDDIMEDFDEKRRDTILKYLKQKAKDKDWCILITKLDKNIKTLELTAA